jgi:phage-related protein
MPKQVYSPKLKQRELFWVGTTLDDLRVFPEEVRLEMGHALHLAMYTVRFASGVYALHAFQKKSHRGIATDQRDIELVERRLQEAERIDRAVRTRTGR